MGARGWPVSLAEGRVGLRPPRWRDGGAWVELRRRNASWLAPWEATIPGARFSMGEETLPSYASMVRSLRRQAREGNALPFVVTYEGRPAGQLTVGNIVRGAMHSAQVGYWVDQQIAGRGVAPTALALVVDHCFDVVGLHRVEADIRPENTASRRVVDKLGFRAEGLRLRYLYIDGAWRDHVCFALTREDVPDGLLARWRALRTDPA